MTVPLRQTAEDLSQTSEFFKQHFTTSSLGACPSQEIFGAPNFRLWKHRQTKQHDCFTSAETCIEWGLYIHKGWEGRGRPHLPFLLRWDTLADYPLLFALYLFFRELLECHWAPKTLRAQLRVAPGETGETPLLHQLESKEGYTHQEDQWPPGDLYVGNAHSCTETPWRNKLIHQCAPACIREQLPTQDRTVPQLLHCPESKSDSVLKKTAETTT